MEGPFGFFAFDANTTAAMPAPSTARPTTTSSAVTVVPLAFELVLEEPFNAPPVVEPAVGLVVELMSALLPFPKLAVIVAPLYVGPEGVVVVVVNAVFGP